MFGVLIQIDWAVHLGQFDGSLGDLTELVAGIFRHVHRSNELLDLVDLGHNLIEGILARVLLHVDWAS